MKDQTITRLDALVPDETHRWATSDGVVRILDELRPLIYAKAPKASVTVPFALLHDLQQLALVLRQQHEHRADMESLRADLRRVERDNQAIRIDCDRKIRDAREHAEACLRLAHKAGVTNDEVTAQIEHDREMVRLGARADEPELPRPPSPPPNEATTDEPAAPLALFDEVSR